MSRTVLVSGSLYFFYRHMPTSIVKLNSYYLVLILLAMGCDSIRPNASDIRVSRKDGMGMGFVPAGYGGQRMGMD